MMFAMNFLPSVEVNHPSGLSRKLLTVMVPSAASASADDDMISEQASRRRSFRMGSLVSSKFGNRGSRRPGGGRRDREPTGRRLVGEIVGVNNAPVVSGISLHRAQGAQEISNVDDRTDAKPDQ